VTPWHVVSMDSLAERLNSALGNAFLIEREIRGGMSRVFVAADRVLSRRVVIKVLDPQLAAGVSVDRFRREILTAAGLQHPHIVGVLSTGEVDGLPFFVMPYVDGESLAEMIHRGPLPVRSVVAILKDVARALAFAHDRGVVHRDIKPGNILLAGGSAMVTDFGVAKALSSAARTGDGLLPRTVITTAGTSLGTLLYMAPEQAAADPEVDGRADIYALGITAFEALTGAPPFADLSARAMLTARMSGVVPPMSPRRSDIPEALEALIRRCLAADPADRPQTARELVELLEAPELVTPTTASGPVVAVPARVRRRDLSIGVGAIVATLLLAGGAAAWHVRSGAATLTAPASSAAVTPAAPLDEVAVIPFVDLGDDSSGTIFAQGLTNAVAGSLTKSGRLRVIAPSVAGEMMRRAGAEPGGRGAISAGMLLEGTVQRDGGRLRVTARLTNASDGVMRWADVYDRDSANALAVQDEIAAAIVAAVTPQSVSGTAAQPTAAPGQRPATQRRT